MVNEIMDRNERLDLIDALAAANAESAAEIERRREQRENDPAAYDRAEREHQQMDAAATSHAETAATSHGRSFPLAETSEWAEPIRSDYVQKFGSDVVLYREHENNEQTRSAADDRHGLFAADPPAEDELCNAFDKFADAIENRLIDVEKENIELKGLLGSALEKVGKLEGKLDAVLALIKPKVWKP